LDWEVVPTPLFHSMMAGMVNADGVSVGPRIPVKGFKALVRDMDQKALSVVSDRYVPIQPREAFELFGRVFGNELVLHTAGSLRGGRTIWGLAEFPGEWTMIGGETHRRFLVVSTTFDGSGRLLAYPTDVRVVCNNTLRMSAIDACDGIRVTHSGDVASKMADAGNALAAAFGAFKDYENQCNALASRTMSNADQTAFVEALFPNDEKAQGRVLFLAQYGDGQRGNLDILGTPYALLQGVTQYVDHETKGGRSKSGVRRFGYQLFGNGNAVKARAFSILQTSGSALAN
jgi:phage/plasmid-like protein (TIGR03299 family)